jgi:hypothetical protein
MRYKTMWPRVESVRSDARRCVSYMRLGGLWNQSELKMEIHIRLATANVMLLRIENQTRLAMASLN